MAAYTDGIHLLADTENELHEFAVVIGLRRKTFIDHKHKHYNLIGERVEIAIRQGALFMDTRQLVTLYCR